MRRRLWPGAAVVAAALAGGAVWLAASDDGDDQRWLTVESGPLVLGVEVGGTLQAVRSDLVGPPLVPGMWNYEIAWLAPEGSVVEKGDRLLVFNPEQLRRRLEQKLAERDSAAAELEKRRLDLERRRRDDRLALAEAEARLRKAELATDVPAELLGAVELETARIDLEVARAEVEHRRRQLELRGERSQAEIGALVDRHDRAAARVEEIQRSVEELTVRAPSAGTVIYATDRRGEKKAVGDSVWQLEKVLEIPDLTRMKALGEVDEADAGRVRPGQRVTLRLDAHPDRVYTGKVVAVRDTVQRRSQLVRGKVMRIEVDLDGTDRDRMRPGMRFAGEVEIERVEDAVLAPTEAIFGTAEGPLAFRRGRFGVEPVRPTIGRRNQRQAEVLDGLSVGDRLADRPPEGWTLDGPVAAGLPVAAVEAR